jgi:hypothetical protein
MSLNWYNEDDKDIFMSLKGLVNNNNGFWKSIKQRSFLIEKKMGGKIREPHSFIKENFGMDYRDGHRYVIVDAIAQWSTYGSRGQVPVYWGFELDDYGITRHYKIGNKGNLRQGARPDAGKTKLLWERPEEAVSELKTEIDEAVEEARLAEFNHLMGIRYGDHIGNIGDKKYEFGTVTLVAKSQTTNFRGEYVTWQRFKDSDGNLIDYTGKSLGLERGDQANLIGNIKAHFESKKDECITRIIYPKVA